MNANIEPASNAPASGMHSPPAAAKPGDTLLTRTSRTTAQRRLAPVENALCGATAGLVSRALVSPFDVVKITLQLETAKSASRLRTGSVIACATRIMHAEGVRGFFKGNLSAEYLYLSYGAMQFLAFGTIEAALRRAQAPKRVRSFVGGALAGALATSVTYPFDLLRTRFIAQELSSRVHSSLVEAVGHIYREEGVRGFYRGLWPACLQIMPYMGIVFTSYDMLASGYRWARRTVLSESPILRLLDPVQDAVIGAGAAVIGKTCVYPLDLVRKRLQIQGPHLLSYAHGRVPKYVGMSDALMYIVRQEGVLALFRGLTPALIKAAPASATVFFVFGHTRDLLLSLRP
ncbi:mitochondrial thiamine pyrophosphate transporter [Coemansia sp. RSA 2706]|nr:mitochondrial thiamine pyrophosphate transporter [Coemansia sp. RSA 2711]KAJ2303986.1 mitochondrial thiamine pyrophosphate transporter [Coemansia sp. RSA 2706]KAJ2309884.1 mitochondrial thiamine pyrophosphate transporter [Coemansia sp. RSA 2705]KAJ2319465.1 mitochondrial thiamine pyrophosphate transporter [Coemansia sp. RSA 2704]KAJ2326310.1 mitochondrial thiamine pyrophosphate transporter [Coemansia sp. RSA 2702]KAJ2366757.1 mitochondrial thiamine pyrophosphate transporter [Coemansia sp. R